MRCPSAGLGCGVPRGSGRGVSRGPRGCKCGVCPPPVFLGSGRGVGRGTRAEAAPIWGGVVGTWGCKFGVSPLRGDGSEVSPEDWGLWRCEEGPQLRGDPAAPQVASAARERGEAQHARHPQRCRRPGAAPHRAARQPRQGEPRVAGGHPALPSPVPAPPALSPSSVCQERRRQAPQNVLCLAAGAGCSPLEECRFSGCCVLLVLLPEFLCL